MNYRKERSLEGNWKKIVGDGGLEEIENVIEFNGCLRIWIFKMLLKSKIALIFIILLKFCRQKKNSKISKGSNPNNLK